jgi:hypothetical protein
MTLSTRDGFKDAKFMATECPCCGKQNTATTGANTSEPPKPGDVIVCIGCGAINQFDKDMALELVKDTSGPDFGDARKVQRAIRIMQGLPV